MWRGPMPNHLDETLRRTERSLDRVGQPVAIRLPGDETVNHDRDVVVLAAIQLRGTRQVVYLTVHPDAHETLFPRRLEDVAKFTFSAAYQRGQDLDLRAF